MHLVRDIEDSERVQTLLDERSVQKSHEMNRLLFTRCTSYLSELPQTQMRLRSRFTRRMYKILQSIDGLSTSISRFDDATMDRHFFLK